MILVVQNGGRTYTANVWKQERFVLLASGSVSPLLVWTNLHGSANAPIAKYALNGSGSVYIDMTDYVRAYPSVATIYVYDVSSTASSVCVNVKGLINPENVNMPTHPISRYGALIIPPQMYYAGQNYNEAIAEFYAQSGTGTWSVGGSASFAADGRTYGQISGDFGIVRNGSTILNYKVRSRMCGVEYINVRWVSFTGIVRDHIFELTKRKQSAKDAYSLLPIDNEYVEIKGREDGFTLRLDRLNTYDLWYYSDILQSSNVQVSFDGQTWERVKVTDKAITLPDGEAGTNGVLEVAVNYRKYDAVAM